MPLTWRRKRYSRSGSRRTPDVLRTEYLSFFSLIPSAAFAPATGRAMEIAMSSQRDIRLNAFDMTCVGHQSPGLWAHPRDRSWQYKDLEYWADLARLLERGKLRGRLIAAV